MKKLRVLLPTMTHQLCIARNDGARQVSASTDPLNRVIGYAHKKKEKRWETKDVDLLSANICL